MKKAFIILGNGFTIDFLSHYTKYDPTINEKIDVRNLFRYGDKIGTPWDDKPGFLSFKYCPSLWTLGAHPTNTTEESNALIEEIITCSNMFFDFVNEPVQKEKRVEMADSQDERIYLKAYSELILYLRHLFSRYNDAITTENLNDFLATTNWGWLDFFRSLSSPDANYDKITFVTYNYDIWLERILKCLAIPFDVLGFTTAPTSQIEIIKPHGSISFVPKGESTNKMFAVSYKLDFDGATIDQLELQYDRLSECEKGIIIPPAGDSMRLKNTVPWANYLRDEARKAAQETTANDEIVLCGLSYWHVDRRELDELLINLNQDSGFTFINPLPPRDLNAVLISIFKNYVQQSSSSMIGGILSGKTV